MPNIIILTHGDFSRGITQSCRLILGNAAAPIPLSIQLDTSTSEVNAMLESAINAYPDNETVLVLTDIPGGSTTRSALSMLDKHPNAIIISGLNLGLLVEIAMLELTGDPLEDRSMIREAVDQARDTIQVINDFTEKSDGDGILKGSDDAEL